MYHTTFTPSHLYSVVPPVSAAVPQAPQSPAPQQFTAAASQDLRRIEPLAPDLHITGTAAALQAQNLKAQVRVLEQEVHLLRSGLKQAAMVGVGGSAGRTKSSGFGQQKRKTLETVSAPCGPQVAFGRVVKPTISRGGVDVKTERREPPRARQTASAPVGGADVGKPYISMMAGPAITQGNEIPLQGAAAGSTLLPQPSAAAIVMDSPPPEGIGYTYWASADRFRDFYRTQPPAASRPHAAPDVLHATTTAASAVPVVAAVSPLPPPQLAPVSVPSLSIPAVLSTLPPTTSEQSLASQLAILRDVLQQRDELLRKTALALQESETARAATQQLLAASELAGSGRSRSAPAIPPRLRLWQQQQQQQQLKRSGGVATAASRSTQCFESGVTKSMKDGEGVLSHEKDLEEKRKAALLLLTKELFDSHMQAAEAREAARVAKATVQAQTKALEAERARNSKEVFTAATVAAASKAPTAAPSPLVPAPQTTAPTPLSAPSPSAKLPVTAVPPPISAASVVPVPVPPPLITPPAPEATATAATADRVAALEAALQEARVLAETKSASLAAAAQKLEAWERWYTETFASVTEKQQQRHCKREGPLRVREVHRTRCPSPGPVGDRLVSFNSGYTLEEAAEMAEQNARKITREETGSALPMNVVVGASQTAEATMTTTRYRGAREYRNCALYEEVVDPIAYMHQCGNRTTDGAYYTRVGGDAAQYERYRDLTSGTLELIAREAAVRELAAREREATEARLAKVQALDRSPTKETKETEVVGDKGATAPPSMKL